MEGCTSTGFADTVPAGSAHRRSLKAGAELSKSPVLHQAEQLLEIRHVRVQRRAADFELMSECRHGELRRPVAVDGRLEWREWETQEGQKRQAVDIIAESVQFLGGRDDANAGGFTASAGGSRSDVPVDERDFQTAASGAGIGDDDIPF